MTVMFIDLAGFTGMSERMGSRIIPLLSRYFDSVSAQVQANGGTIDKFIGDAVMAFWGAPQGERPTCRRLLPGSAGVPTRGFRSRSSRRRRPSRENPDRHQFRRHAGRQYRLGGTPELHRDRRRGEHREPAREHQQAIRIGHHHRPGDAPPRGRPHIRCANWIGWRSMAAPAACKSTNCSEWPRGIGPVRLDRRITNPGSPPIARRISPAPSAIFRRSVILREAGHGVIRHDRALQAAVEAPPPTAAGATRRSRGSSSGYRGVGRSAVLVGISGSIQGSHRPAGRPAGAAA